MDYLKTGYVQTKSFNYYAMLAVYAFLLLPFLSLSGVQSLMGSAAYSAYQSGAMVLLCVLVLFKVRYLPKDKFPWLYLAFYGLVFYSTVQHYGFSMGILVTTLAGFFIALLIERDTELIIRALAIISVFALLFNFLTIFRLGLHSRTDYFVGGKNSMSIFLIPSAFMVMANTQIRKGRLTWFPLCYFALTAITVFLTGSATGIVTAIAMCIGAILVRRFKPSVFVLIICLIAAQFILVFLTDTLSQLPVWTRILDLLGKEETLTSRAAIWDQTIDLVERNWLTGLGRGVQIQYLNSWGQRKIVGEAHNFFLELLLEGGILGAVLYIMLLLVAVRNLNMDNIQHRIVLICFAVMMINGLAEAINNKMYVTIILAMLNAYSQSNTNTSPVKQ